jgi:hypothetical protein
VQRFGGGWAQSVVVDEERYALPRIPLQFAYAQRTAGQGFQIFAGPYLGILLGGRNKLSYGSSQETSRVIVTNEHTSSISPYAVSVPDYNYYARRLDLGA